jgi:transcriptional regulator with XRE-family HTH domain
MSESRDVVAPSENEDTIKQFGAELRALIRCADMSERAVGRRTNTSASTMSGYLNGINLIRLETLRGILRALNVTDADQASWTKRWEALKAAPKPPKRRHADNLNEVIAKSVRDIGAELPSGTKVVMTIEFIVP